MIERPVKGCRPAGIVADEHDLAEMEWLITTFRSASWPTALQRERNHADDVITVGFGSG
jgi:hypothetical protein